MLTISGLEASYGSIQALKGIDIEVRKGEFVAILGPNGAGKSTLMKTIMGVLRPRAGSVQFEGRELDHLPTVQRVQLGISIIPEGRQLFSDMTVRENLLLGAYAQLGFSAGAQANDAIERIFRLFPKLRERHRQTVGSLSGGEAQMVAVGRALMSEPRLLLCDEPSLGLAPIIVRELLDTLDRLRGSGITIMLADQNAHSALRLVDRAYILDTGRVVGAGPSASLIADQRLRAAYLGGVVDEQPS